MHGTAFGVVEFEEKTGRYTVHMGCQGTFGMRKQLAALLNLEPAKVRVLTKNVGGSFGMALLVGVHMFIACCQMLGSPIKWTTNGHPVFFRISKVETMMLKVN